MCFNVWPLPLTLILGTTRVWFPLFCLLLFSIYSHGQNPPEPLLLWAECPRSSSAELLSSQSAPSLYWSLGLLKARCRNLHFPLLNLMRIFSFLFPFKGSLGSSVPMWCISCSIQFCVICELAEDALLSLHTSD